MASVMSTDTPLSEYRKVTEPRVEAGSCHQRPQHPVTAQTYTNTQSLTLSRNTG